MADKNKFKLMVGLALIFISFLCVVVIVYFMGQANKTNTEKIAYLQVQLTNLIAEKAVGQLKAVDASRVKREPVTLENVLGKSENGANPQELDRKEGILWIDRQTSKFTITLGRANGLSEGSPVTIFDGDKKIDDVIVQNTFDIISYVKPQEKKIGDFEKNYYRVEIKKAAAK